MRVRVRGLLTAFVVVQAAMVGGCLPLQYNYLEPSAPTGKVEQWRGACGGAYNYITFTAPNYSWVQVRLSTSEFDFEKRIPAPLALVVAVRKQIPIEYGPFADEEKQAVYDSWHARKITLVPKAGWILVSWEGGGRAELPISLPDAKSVLVLDERKESIEWEIAIPEFSGQFLDVQMPPFLIDGAELDFPSVHFQRVNKLLSTPINC
jgi:hypothetical protein